MCVCMSITIPRLCYAAAHLARSMVHHRRHTGVAVDVGTGAKAIQQPIDGTYQAKGLLKVAIEVGWMDGRTDGRMDG